MKQKKFNKKLTLNKTTISSLNSTDLKAIVGGFFTEVTGITCTYCDTGRNSCIDANDCMWDKSCMITCHFE